MIKTASYPTPQDAEAAFYEALEAADIDAMMQVWADDEDIVCVHPGGARLAGYDKVRDSWAQIFSGGQRLKVMLSDQVYVQGMMVSVHSLQENIAVAGEPRTRHPVVATNIYLRTAGGWRLIAHHASPAPQPVREAPAESPKILH
jgi:ketosteroid isomerase-like protein